MLGDTRHAKTLEYAQNLQYSVTVSALTYGRRKRPSKLIPNGWPLPRGLDFRYKAATNVPGPYDVLWQVVNTGKHAADAYGLRGEFFHAKGRDRAQLESLLVNWESTSYTGTQWIECFIVKSNECVARSGKFYVR